MPYSLLSRFRGMFLGALLGEVLPEVLARQDGDVPAERTVNGGGVFVSDRSAAIATTTLSLIQTYTVPNMEYPPEQYLAAVLPLGLYFHDDSLKLQQQVAQTLPPSPLLDAAHTVAQGIAIALRPHLDPLDTIPAITSSVPLSPALQHPLLQVQDLLQQRASLATAVQVLQPEPTSQSGTVTGELLGFAIALTFYCWLSAPAPLSVCLQRTQHAHVPPLTRLLTGALVGSASGAVAIPTPWLMPLDALAPSDERLPQAPELQPQGLTPWIRLADQLLAAWAGCPPSQGIKQHPSTLQQIAVAAPGIIRPR